MNIVLQSKFAVDAGFVDCNGITILKINEAWNISNESPVKGFPLAIYQFVNNAKYFQLGVNFFDRPTDAMLEELKEIRRKGEDHRKYKLQYAVMVYTAISGNCIHPDKSLDREGVEKIIDAIYGGNIKLKKCNISDTIHDIKGSYLVIEPNQTSYRFHHQTLLESVILSFALIDEEHINDIIPLLSWSFIQKMVKPDTYNEREGEVVLKIPTTSYKILAFKLVDTYKKSFNGQLDILLDSFLDGLTKTEIFQQDFYCILPHVLEAVIQDDNKYEDTKYLMKFMFCEMCSISSVVHMKSTTFFLCTLLMSVAKAERQFDIYDSILQMLNQIFKKSNNSVNVDHIKGTFVTSLYEICATKDVSCVKATLDLVKENKMPVILDQAINLSVIGYYSHYLCSNSSNKTNCIFLTFCIWKAYEVLNIHVMEYLLSLYNETRFDVNLFFKFIYRTDLMKTCSSLSHKPLKWMVERYENQEFVETDFIIPIACLYRLFDTVTYLASRCNVFDAVSCLEKFLYDSDDIDAIVYSLYFDLYKDLYDFLFSRIDITSSDMNSIIISILQKSNIPDYFCETLLPVCIDNGELLNIACKEGIFYMSKLILEKSLNVSIQSALLSACTEANGFEFLSRKDDEKLKIVKHIIGKYGCEQFDLKVVCEQAYHSKKFKIIEWFVQNIDIALLNVNCILDSALLYKESNLLEYICSHTIELVSLDKNKVLTSVTKYFTAKYSTKILEIVSIVWDSTENKEELNIPKMVETGYDVQCFEMLIWIHENCNARIDAMRILMLACEKSRVDIAKWVLKTFEETSLDINKKKLLMLPVDAMLSTSFMEIEMIDTMNWVLETFQIPPLDLKEFLFKLMSLNKCVHWSIIVSYPFFDLIVSIFQKYGSLFSSEDMEELMNTALENSHFELVNWFLEHKTSYTFDKQHILNKACSSTNTLNFATVMTLTKSFHLLDTNQAFIQACIHNQQLICEHLFRHIRENSVDICTLVSTVCKETVSTKYNDIMKWILQNVPHDQISVNNVLISLCQKGKFDFVKYIFQTEDNEKLHTVSAFFNACLNPYEYQRDQKESLRVIDFLFKKLPDKLYSLSFVLNGLLEKKNHAVILYFLEQGFYRSIDMSNLLNEVCRHGHCKLVQWILENIDHTELDIKSAFYEACTTKDVCMYSDVKLHCVVLFKHYIQNMYVFDLDPILEIINETPSDFPNQYDDLINCLLNIKTLRGDDIEK